MGMEIQRIKGLVAAGALTVADVVSPDAMRIFKYRGMLREELLRSMNRMRTFAIGQVRDELRRQGVTPK